MTLSLTMKTLTKVSVRKFIDNIVPPPTSGSLTSQISAYSAHQQKMLNDAGYCLVTLQYLFRWTELHGWLQANVNQIDYSWFGSNFWFTHERDAMWFALKFSGVK